MEGCFCLILLEGEADDVFFADEEIVARRPSRRAREAGWFLFPVRAVAVPFPLFAAYSVRQMDARQGRPPKGNQQGGMVNSLLQDTDKGLELGAIALRLFGRIVRSCSSHS